MAATDALVPLWKIDDDLLALVDSLETCPEELQQELETRIEEYLSREAKKIDSIAAVLTSLENVQANAKAEIERLSTREQSAAKAAARLEMYVLKVLRNREWKPLKGNNVTLSVRPTTALVITDPDLVPPAWKRISPTVDIPKDPIKAALKRNEEVPGVVLQERYHLVRK